MFELSIIMDKINLLNPHCYKMSIFGDFLSPNRKWHFLAALAEFDFDNLVTLADTKMLSNCSWAIPK